MTTPFSSKVCLRALASRTLTFGTGSEARLKRLGSKCSTNWSTGIHSSSTTAYKIRTEHKKARFMLKLQHLPFLSILSLILSDHLEKTEFNLTKSLTTPYIAVQPLKNILKMHLAILKMTQHGQIT